MEEMFDLNEPHYFGSLFDLVIDAGTIEHCANIGQALMNAANAVWPGGYVFHSPPLAMMNHGFYNVSPTLLADFYQQNGWRVAHLSAFKVAPPYDDVPIDPTGRFPAVNGTALYFLAQRLTAGVLRWPTQTRYQAKAAA